MSTKNKIEQLQKLYNEIVEELSSTHIKEKTCMCCGINKIKPIYSDRLDPLNQERGCWDNGAVEKLTPGFGSKFDLFEFYIAICDDCIEKSIKNNTLENIKQIRRSVADHIDTIGKSGDFLNSI